MSITWSRLGLHASLPAYLAAQALIYAVFAAATLTYSREISSSPVVENLAVHVGGWIQALGEYGEVEGVGRFAIAYWTLLWCYLPVTAGVLAALYAGPRTGSEVRMRVLFDSGWRGLTLSVVLFGLFLFFASAWPVDQPGGTDRDRSQVSGLGMVLGGVTLQTVLVLFLTSLRWLVLKLSEAVKNRQDLSR